MALAFRYQWVVGFVFAMLGVFELTKALTHKTRWIRARLKSLQTDKLVDIEFRDDDLQIETAHSKGTVQYSAFQQIIPAEKGVFLIPGTQTSLYIPQDSVDPPDAYNTLIEMLQSQMPQQPM